MFYKENSLKLDQMHPRNGFRRSKFLEKKAHYNQKVAEKWWLELKVLLAFLLDSNITSVSFRIWPDRLSFVNVGLHNGVVHVMNSKAVAAIMGGLWWGIVRIGGNAEEKRGEKLGLCGEEEGREKEKERVWTWDWAWFLSFLKFENFGQNL